MQEKSSGHVQARLRELFEGMKRVQKNLPELAAGLSTGLAQEMQKGSRQYSVLIPQVEELQELPERKFVA